LPLPPIPRLQTCRVVLGRPLDHQLPSPLRHPLLAAACCLHYAAWLGGIGITSLAPWSSAAALAENTSTKLSLRFRTDGMRPSPWLLSVGEISGPIARSCPVRGGAPRLKSFLWVSVMQWLDFTRLPTSSS